MGNIGMPELIVIFVVALLVFGPKRLPELGRSLGRGISEFRRASTDLRSSIEREIQTADAERSIAPTPTPPAENTGLNAPKS
jgi:sec-independent protein translocase protein TatA